MTGAQLGGSPAGPAGPADLSGSLPGPAGVSGGSALPVDAAEGLSRLPLAAPFTPASGWSAPPGPAVPTLPNGSGGAIPGAADGSVPGSSSAGSSSDDLLAPVRSPAGAVPAAPTDHRDAPPEPAALAGPGLPSLPQPPLPVPDPPAPVPTPSSPFYFLAESSAYQDAPDLESLAAAALNPLAADPAQVGVPSLGLPASVDVPSGLLPTAGAVPPAAGAPTYYFADRVEPPTRRSADAAQGAAPRLASDPHPPFDVRLVRRDFPILAERVNGHQLVWFDNAATTQKPQAVIDRLAHFYRHENSNIHRAAHELAARATDAYEGARKTVARFIGAESEKNIVFVRGATEAINLVAKSWGKANIHRGDEIIVSHLEHHANIVPWQQLCAESGAKLRVIPVDDSGQLLLEEFSRLLCEKTKLVAVTQVSNALGTVTPVDAVVEMAHRAGACVLIDGAQSIPHIRVNMQALGADFFVFSGHKIYGPTGIGVVYGRTEVLESMPPWEGGGNMIADVTFEKTVFQHPPNRFEAGTGNIADAVGLGAALDYVTRIGVETIARYEHQLLEYATPRMQAVPGLRLIGTARDKASVLSFVLDGYRTEEVGAALNQKGIAVRSGHHCAQPILRRFGLEATVRPSVAFYNTTDEIDRMIAVLHRLAADRGRR
ncbi:family 2A encapsulin nanocompartment cargo protein cysteine desulfurase [Nakamurella sp.]|uniref:family 2A encapsulin nanocompartment cargo protein cysteine desulfurase n=1 Tax=Nakamurella sp. TaxID=1869182 RepID=UPI00387E8E3E